MIIRERSLYFFNNEFLSDVYFVVELFLNEIDDFFELDLKKCKMVIFVYKFVLVIGSLVFYVMFYGEMVGKNDIIIVFDCEYESFLELFCFLYSDEVYLILDNVM